MTKETKPIRISSTVHKKLKIYAAKAEVNIVDVIDAATLGFMADYPPESLHDKQKSNKQPSKK